jgi:hypothetical protein
MRRLFWIGVGAGLGISGYRRASRVVKEIAGPVPRRPRLRLRQLGGLAAFARDVREGMDIYSDQQRSAIESPRAPEGPTLGWHPVSSAETSRNGSAAH